jgi:hypothetical protein
MEIVFIILGKFTISNTHKIIDFETTILACPWILEIIIIFQFFPIFADISKKIQGK